MNKNNKQLCPTCKTGQDTYLLDSKNPFCPYIQCHKGNTCSMYVPLKQNTEQDNEHCKSVRKNSVKADTQVVHYENKDIPMDAGEYFTIQDESVYGKYLGTEVLPNDPKQLKTVLDNEKHKWDGFPLGDIENHIKELESGRKPSIRKQLADNKAKIGRTPKQIKSKNTELEV